MFSGTPETEGIETLRAARSPVTWGVSGTPDTEGIETESVRPTAGSHHPGLSGTPDTEGIERALAHVLPEPVGVPWSVQLGGMERLWWAGIWRPVMGGYEESPSAEFSRVRSIFGGLIWWEFLLIPARVGVLRWVGAGELGVDPGLDQLLFLVWIFCESGGRCAVFR